MVFKRLALLFVVGLFAALSIASLFTQQTSAAAPTDLDGQIKSYKLYNTLDNCFADRVKILDTITAGEIASWDIFNGQIGAGAIVSGGKGDGNVDCKQQMADAASLWGITDPVAFLKKAGWDIYTVTQDDYTACSIGSAGAGGFGGVNNCPLPGKYYKKPTSDPGGKFQNAAKSYLDNKAPSYAAYFPYEDGMKTLAICGVKVTNGAPNETAKAEGARSIWLVGKDGSPTEATASKPNVNSMYFGPASNPFSHDTTCSEVVDYLSDKNNAVKFWGSLPAAIKATWTGISGVGVDTNGQGDAKSACVIPGVGWILCPVTSFLADVADNTYKFLADNFLRVDKDTVGTSSPTYAVWSTMRNIANVAFVIAFLFIIFSQLTGQGVTNYGIKKMLPRLIIAAVLVNLSFIVCQIAVDLSNILGVSVKQAFDSVSGGLPAPSTGGDENGNVWAGLAVGVLGGIGIAWALGISVLLPFLLAALIAFLMVFFILIVRQVLIILLVVVAPIAFVAFLLPNTEQWFTKWRKMFVGLLLVFPLIGLVFGAAGLAAKVIASSAYGTVGAPGDGDFVKKIIAAGIVALPLFLLPSLLKKSLDAAGNIGTILNNAGKKMSGGARSRTANSGVMKSLAAQKAQKRMAISNGTYKGRNPLGRLGSRVNRGFNNNRAFNAVTGGFGADRTLAGQAQQRKDSQEAMAMFGGDDDLVKAWADSGGNLQKAIQQGLVQKGSARAEQFRLMENAGHAKKATSFMAAAQYMSENGKGSATSLSNALGNASRAGATATQVSGSWQAAQAAYRKAGRGDVVGEMSAHFAANGNLPPTSTGDLAKTSQADIVARKEAAWKEVAPEAVHREAIDPSKNPDGYNSYVGHLNNDRQHTADALAGYDKMEARAKTIASNEILTAAQSHQRRETGSASTITNIQEAKAYFGVK